MLTAIGVDDVGSPLLGGRVKKTGRVNLGPDGTRAIEGGGGGRRLGNVDLDRTLVASRDGVFTCALVMLVPFEAEIQVRKFARDGWE